MYINYNDMTNNVLFNEDKDGRIIYTTTNQIVGISLRKKDEIIADYKSVCNENQELQNKINEYEKILLDNGLIQPEPTIESLQAKILEMEKARLIEMEELKQLLKSNNAPNKEPKDKKGE